MSAGGDPGVDTAGLAAIVRARLFDEAAPHRVGRFTVLERLGAGGMGVVYAAFDAELDRRVAIKLLVAGGDDRGRLAREAQVMARLNHPNVAHVYEVGRHGECTYVAMEYVRGRTLRAWALDENPGRRERLAALEQAGRGLAAAHATGVIHRDFKPDNVMMGDDGRVRVLDFGLARHVEDRAASTFTGDDARTRDGSGSEPATDRSTAAGAGTPAYAAPEQSRGEPIDARADVYSFCVTAWEVLSGRRPTGDAPTDPSIPRWIERVLRRGLMPDREQRPPSIDAILAELARDPAVVRRRLIAVVGCLGIVAGGLGWQRAAEIRRERACEREAATIDEVWSDAHADEIAAAFEATDLGYAPDAFERARTRIDDFSAAWSDARASVCMAEVEGRADAASDARACLDDRLTHVRALLARFAEPDREIVQLAIGAAAAMPDPRACADPRSNAGRTEGAPPAQAEHRQRLIEIDVMLQTAALEPALAAAEALAAELSSSGGVELAQAQLAVGQVLRDLGRYEPCRAAFEAAFYAAGAASDDFTALEAATALVDTVGSRLAQPERAEEWARTARMYVDRLGLDDHPAVAALENNIGTMLMDDPKGDRSLVALRRALEIRERVYGPLHPAVGSSHFNIGVALVRRGELDAGIDALRRAVEIDEETLGPDHPDVANVLNVLGSSLMDRGEYDAAMVTLQRALALVEHALGPEHESVGSILISIANLDMRLGHASEAIARYERALGITERTFGSDHPRFAAALAALGLAHENTGDTTTALREYGRALAIQERALGPDHGSLAPILGNMGIITMNSGDIDAGVEMLRRTENIMSMQYGADAPQRAVVLTAIGWADITRGRHDAAIEPLEEALAVLVRAGVADEMRAETEYELARALLGAGRDRERALELARSVVRSWTPMGAARADNLAEAEALVRALER